MKGRAMHLRLRCWLGFLLLMSGCLQMAAAQTTVKYVHTDVLGSVVAMTDASGNVVEAHREYEPYGYQSSPALRDGPGYTGHVQDAHTGLTYMQQRYYDPAIGRFLSVDPVTAYQNNDWRHFNRYGYAYGNPYRFLDPDGLAGCDDAKGQGLSGRCIQSSNFTEKNMRTTDATSTAEVDSKIGAFATTANQSSGNEMVVRADAASTVIGLNIVREVSISSVPTFAATPTSAEFAFAEVATATAVGHTHPTDGNTIVPGTGDAGVVNRGIPNFVMHGQRVVVVEVSGGQFRARVTSGSVTGAERRLIQQRLNQFQSVK